MTTQKKHEAAPYGHNNWYIAGFIVSVVLFAATALLAHHHTISGVELKVFRHINDLSNKLTWPMKIATIAPDSEVFAAAAVVLAFLFRFYRLSWRLAVELVAGYVSAEAAKILVGRKRPFELLSNVHLRSMDTGNGFPSGHTMAITIIMFTLLPYLPKMWRWIVPVPIILVGFARVYLGVHAPLDIVGGFAVGLGVVSFVRILPQSLKVALRLD
jgi:undecaprenyl-diphosphatase